MLLTALSIVSVLAEDSDIWNSEYYDYDKYSYNEINKLFDETPNSIAARNEFKRYGATTNYFDLELH